MTFILVTLAIMGASIFLIYKLTNYFGFRMKYRSLILCAFMAFFVNIAAISMSPYLTQAHYIRLVLLVIAAAAVVTIYNEHLVRSDRVAAASTGEELPPEAAEVTENGASAIRERLIGKVSSMFAALTEKAASLRKSPGEAPETGGGASTEEAWVPPAEIAPSPADKAAKPPAEKPGSTEAKESEPLRQKPLPTAGKKAAKPKPLPAIDLSKFHSLDDFLDFAYERKTENHPEEAIAAYRGALKKYRDDAYAPFIVIDLGNIYKERAAYEDAIETYKSALSLPIIANDAATLGKFKENLSYLRTVQYILSKHDSLDTPFQDIPVEYLKEIEAEFQVRQKQS